MSAPFLVKDTIKFVQITYLHLFASASEKIFGIESNNRFSQVLQHIKQHELGDTDAIILTGDLSQDETFKSYNYLKMLFKDAALFCYERLLSGQYWHFILLDTTVKNSASGYLREKDLTFIMQEIETVKKK